MRYDHFTMLPERAFQPRGRGMTLEGGGGGIIGGIVDVVKDVGSFIDDNIIQPIVKDPISAVATVVGATFGGPVGAGIGNTVAGLVQGESPEEAVKGGVVSGLTASAGQALLGSTPTTSNLPSVADIASNIGPGVGPGIAPIATPANVFEYGFPAPSFGTTATDIATNADALGIGTGVGPGIAPAAGAGAGPAAASGANVFEYGFPEPLTPFKPAAAPNISLKDAFQGARLVSSLLTPQQQQIQQQDIGNIPQGAVDYNTLLGLLNQRASAAGLLGTRFQPQSINIASLLG